MNTQYQDQNNDLISRSWLLEQLDGLGDTRLIKRNFVALVTNAPTVDDVPVVRCRECKYRFKNNGHDKSGCPIIDTNIWMDDDDFCSHGEGKEGADNG